MALLHSKMDAPPRSSVGVVIWRLTRCSAADTQHVRYVFLLLLTTSLASYYEGVPTFEHVLRDALAFGHRQYMETDVVDHSVVPGDHQSIAFEAGFAELRSDASK